MKKSTVTAVSTLLATASVLVGCSGEPTKLLKFGIEAENLVAAYKRNKPEDRPSDDAFRTAQLSFAAELIKNTHKAGENTLVSPLSVMVALSMTANGADGETLREMESVLGGTLSIDDLNAYLCSYVENLPQSERAKLTLADSIWINEIIESQVHSEFLQKMSDFYAADVYKAPFNDQTLKDVNSWVSEKTDRMIPKILDELSPDSRMILINALRFEAEWALMYDEVSVSDGEFHAADGSRQPVTLMQSDEYNYLSDAKVQGIRKSYRDGYSFVALLPKEGSDVDSYLDSLDGSTLQALLASEVNCKVSASLPKFRSSYSVLLNECLKSMGIDLAFLPEGADFSKMCSEALYIDNVLHKTFIEVGEKGTRAGAVTAVIMDAEGIPEEPLRLTFDRPFIYMIVEDATDTPIFIGALNHLE